MTNRQRDDNRPNRTRRAIYVFGLTASLLLSSIYFTAFPTTSGIANNYVDQAFGVIQIVVLSYLASSSIDNADLLTKVTRRRPKRPNVSVDASTYPNDPPDDEEDAVDPRDSIHNDKGNGNGNSNGFG